MDDLKHVKFQVYSADWCPDCRRLEQWLGSVGIVYEKADIEKIEGAAGKLESETGKRAIPFILVNEQTWIRGYHKELPQRFSPDLLIQEIKNIL